MFATLLDLGRLLKCEDRHGCGREEILSRQNVNVEQRILREATERYLDSPPPMHRELFQLMAADYKKPPYALIAGAIEDAIVKWRSEVLSDEADRKPTRLRLA